MMRNESRTTFSRGLAGLKLPSLNGMASSAALQALLAHFRTADGSPARSIAVVGSSGNLLRRGFGADIDRHDVILRINDAFTAGYEHDCGFGSSSRSVRVGWVVGLRAAAQRGQLRPDTLVLVTGQKPGSGGSEATARWAVTAGAAGAVPLGADFLMRSHAILGNAGTWPSTMSHTARTKGESLPGA